MAIYVYFRKNIYAIKHGKNGQTVKNFITEAEALAWMNRQNVQWSWTEFDNGDKTAYGTK